MNPSELKQEFYHFQRCVIRLKQGIENADLEDEIYAAGIIKHFDLSVVLGSNVMKGYLEFIGSSIIDDNIIKSAIINQIEINGLLWIEMMFLVLNYISMIVEQGTDYTYEMISKIKSSFLDELRSTVEVMKNLIDDIDNTF